MIDVLKEQLAEKDRQLLSKEEQAEKWLSVIRDVFKSDDSREQLFRVKELSECSELSFIPQPIPPSIQDEPFGLNENLQGSSVAQQGELKDKKKTLVVRTSNGSN